MGSIDDVNTDNPTDDLNLENLELDVPLYFNELLYEASDFLLAGSQDYLDGAIQLRSIAEDVKGNNVWSAPVVTEAINSVVTDINTFVTKGTATDNVPVDFVDFLGDFSQTFNTHVNNFSEYAIYLEYVVAQIESALFDSLSGPDYYDLMDQLKGNTSIDSLAAFASNPAVQDIGSSALGYATKRSLSVFGRAMAPSGLSLLQMLLTTGDLAEGAQLAALKEGLHRFLYGNIGNNTPDLKEKGAEAPKTFGAKIKGVVLGAGAAFALYEALSYLRDGKLDVETTVVNAARALVNTAAGYAGTAVTSSLSTTLAQAGMGAAAGPIGLCVTVTISVVGNLLIDGIRHSYDYASNDVPRHYEETTYSSVKSDLIKNGYLRTAPSFFRGESVYDTFAKLNSADVDQSVSDYFISTALGEPYGSLDTETLGRYENIIREYRAIHSLNAYNDLPYYSSREFYASQMQESILDFNESDREFLYSLFDFFDKKDTYPWIQDIYDGYM